MTALIAIQAYLMLACIAWAFIHGASIRRHPA